MKNFLRFLLMLLAFAPLAMQAQLTATFGTGTSATGTGGNAGAPMSYGGAYSWVQQIYSAAEFTAAGVPAGAVITSIWFYNATGQTTMPDIRTYMGHRSTTTFSGTSDWAPYNTLTLVDSGDWVAPAGWFEIQLDQPFVWNGTENVVVGVSFRGAHSDYSTNNPNCGYQYTTQSGNAHIRRFSTTLSSCDPTSTAAANSVSTARPNLRISYVVSGCASIPPTVSNIGPYTADLNWMNFQQSVSSWDLIYGETGIVDTLTGTLVTNITDTFYTLTGLTSSTSYSVWMKPTCSGDVGPWSAPRTFTTNVSCPAPTNVAIQLGADGQSGTLTWTAGFSETEWDIYIPTGSEVPNTSSTPTASVTTNSYSVTGLSNSTDYTIYVRANCGAGDYSFWIPVSFRTPQIPATLPYTQNWENGTENAQWTILNNTATNKWYIGGAVNNGGDSSLYISNDNGATNNYTISTESNVWAYRDIYFDPNYGEYEVSFDYRAHGESCCDYIKVFLGPCTEPSGNTTPTGATQLGTNMNMQDNWTNASFSLTSSVAGVQRLYFLWHNDGSVGTAPPAAIDNITVAGYNCGRPSGLTVNSTTQTSAQVSFTPATSNDSQWEIIILAPGDTIDPSLAIPLTTTSYDFQNLASGIQYSVYVRTDCSGDYSAWEGPLHITLGIYNMGTSGWDTLYTCGSVIYDNGGPNGDYANSVSAYLVVYPDQQGSFVQIHGSLLAESYSCDYLTIYDGVGTTNQILSTTQSSNSLFTIPTITSTTGPLTIYFHSDGSVVYSGYEIFTTCVSCVSPSPTVTNLSYDEATLDWSSFTGTQTDFEIVYGPAGFNPNNATPEAVSNVTSYTLTGLTDNTTYDAYIHADCGDGTYSTWEHITFTTNPLCTEPRNVTVSQVTGSSALVSWSAALIGASDYTVEYSEAGQNNWIPQIVTGTSLFLSGLTPSTAYEVKVYSNCAAGSADTINKSFITPCLSGGDPFVDGTVTTYQLPLNNYYNYSYTQQIYLASEMGGAATIDSIAFYYSYATASTDKTSVTIYLGHTSQSTFSGESSYIPSTGLQQVYTGHMNCHQGWNTFVFTTPFQYNGTDNLVVVVDDNSGDYNGSSYVFRAHNAGDTRSLYFYSDSNNPDPANPTSAGASSSTTTNRSDVKFFIPCDNTATCIAPNIAVASVDQTTAEIIWVPGYSENSWNLEYKAASDANWTTVPSLSGSTYTITGLNANTEYSARMQSNCGGGDVSGWITVNFRTTCGQTTALPFVENFDSYGTGTGIYPSCWGKINTYSSDRPYIISTSYAGAGSLYFYAGTSGTYNIAATPEFDSNINISDLQAMFMYRATYNTDRLIVGVMTDPTDAATFVPVATLQPSSTASDWIEQTVYFNNYTGNGHYIAFKNEYTSTSAYAYIDNLEIGLIPTCPKPNNLTVTGTTSSSVTLTWTESGTATDWNVVYGPVGFDPDTVVTNIEYVNTTPTVTVSNLASGTPYEFYVQASCGGGDESYWRGPVTATPGSYNMHTSGWDTLYTCGAAIYDDGGPTGNYSNSVDAYLVIYPEQPGSFVQISGTMVAESSTWDRLTIYDGVGTTNQILQTNQSSGSTYTIPIITSSTGPLTIYFHTDGSGTYAGYEILTTCVNCVSPALTVNNITTTEATLDWSSFTGSQTNFEIVYGAPGINPDNETPIVVSNVTSYTLTGLTAATAYVAYIRTDCGDGSTYGNWNQVSFNTDCIVISTFPHTENFDAVTGGMPACWTSTGSGTNWEVTSSFHGNVSSAHSGSRVMQFYQGGSGDQATLQLPTFDLTSLTYPTLSFWYTNEDWAGDQDEMIVYYRTSPTGTWTQLGTYNSSVSTWTFDSLALPSPSANYQIKFEGISDYGYGINLDDISIYDGTGGGGPVVTDPTVATNAASNIAQTNATLNATITNPDNVTITARGFEWKATTGGTYTQIAGTGTGNTFTANLTGLTPNTGYTFKAFITFNGTTVYGSEMTFTTLDQGQETCAAPTNVTASNITNNSADISWTQQGDVTSWDVNYKVAGATAWNSATTTTNPYTLSGLSDNTTYEVQVIAHCTNGVTSDPSATITLTTVGINDYELNNVVVYPNPTTGMIQIQNSESMIQDVEVYDAYGKLLNAVNVNDHAVALDLSGYAAGTYFVKIVTENGVVTKRVVKQ